MVKEQQSAAGIPVERSLISREIDVMKCLAQGLSNREIVLKLSISTRTVRSDLRRGTYKDPSRTVWHCSGRISRNVTLRTAW